MACCDHDCLQLKCPEKALISSKDEEALHGAGEDRPPPYHSSDLAESQNSGRIDAETKKPSKASVCAACFLLLVAIAVIGALLGRECSIQRKFEYAGLNRRRGR